MKKVWKFISSMRFAIALLIVLAVACSIGSLITQGQTASWYAQRYSERTAALIIALGLDDAFHSPWFIAITAFLCLNLTLCNLVRLPQLIRRTRAFTDPAAALKGEGDVRCDGADPDAVFAALRMPKAVPCRAADGREARFTAKHAAGLWGAWVCHLGILLLILGFALGQMTQRQTIVYGVPGQTLPVGDTGYEVTIDDFIVDRYDSDAVEQYTTKLTVAGPDAAPQSASVSVNHPARLFGMTFYQNSTGWAADVSVTEDGDPLQSEVLCAGEYLRVKDKPELVVCLNAVYPDYVKVPGGMPSTASDQLNNPAYLYSVYYQDQVIGMNVLMPDESLTIDAYEVRFANPRSYSLIQVKVDRFQWLALLGALVTLLGLALAFYVQPARAWAMREESGAWTVYGHSPKGGALFRERFLRAANRGQSAPERKE